MSSGMYDNTCAIILAAGKGTRMKSKDTNKVALRIGGKPIISHTISNLRRAGINNIVIVVGFAKDSVIEHLDDTIKVAVQSKRMGTGHAVKVGLEKVENAENVLVFNGDDSYVYRPELIQELLTKHNTSNAQLTFLSLIVDNPTGLGRIVRDDQNNVAGIVEEKDASEEQIKIKEINPACYVFSYNFLKNNISKIPKSPISNEYYVTSLMEMAVEQKCKIETVTVEGLPWRGINTPDELKEAEKILQSVLQ